jgi:hypothetical protein
MWIIPKTLSHFVPDTEGLNLALDEQAWMCEQSLMLRSKHSLKATWLRRLKKGGWMTQLAGRILKPSLHQSFEEKYTESLEDIHANLSAVRESEKEKKTQGTYGRTSESTSGQLDLFGAFSRTSEVTSRWGYGESCPIWKKMVTERSLDCTQRRKQARHTNASDASSLGGWATPQASDHVEGARTAKESNQKCLGRDLNQMENWPTPRAGAPEESYETWLKRMQSKDDPKCNTKTKPDNLNVEVNRQHAGPPAPEKSNTSGKNHGSPKLSANWVEQLMGLEVGWTQLPTEWIGSDS